ncbi:MAG: hypothetical protein OXH69_14955 [Acidobacteria bacterium]|nr:hypothetical protein [Acidobacteriota bacterium]
MQSVKLGVALLLVAVAATTVLATNENADAPAPCTPFLDRPMRAVPVSDPRVAGREPSFLRSPCLRGFPGETAAQTTAPADIYRWLAPDAAVQAASATTAIPPGLGAILVPSMSGPDSEPQALVFRGGEQVASGPTGARILVEPGAYLVRVGSGAISQMVSVPVDVQAGATTVVPAQWGGLRIEVVDESNLPHRSVYEVIRVVDRQPYTVGFGADTLQGERLLTLLMAPGLYRIVQSGSTYRARTDFATVLVPEGGLVRYRLVINPTSGQFRGAGVMTPDELGAAPDVSSWDAPEVSPWNRRYAIGLSAPWTSTRNVIGASNETAFGADLFFDHYVTYQRDRDLFSVVVELESGFVKVTPEASAARPWQKTHDRFRSDVLYSRFLNPRVGPYARFGLRTALFESNTLVTEDTLISRQLVDGRRELTLVPANSTFPTGDAFSPPEYREGFGLNTRLLQGRTVRLDWRVGAGFRQNRFAGAFFLDDDEATPELEYVEATNFHETGLETTVVATARYRFLLYNTSLDLFSNYAAPEPAVDWRSTLSWRLTPELSLDYKVDLLRLPRVSERNQVAQRLLFRYSIGS